MPLQKQFKHSIRLLKYIASGVYFDIRANKLGQKFPLKPRTLNLLVNDICNSKCQMCLIWQRKQEFEISPQNLANILKDPLFNRLKHIGVSGGEPTLRSDLPDIFQVIVNKKKPIYSAGIITNAINADQVIEKIVICADICKKSNIKFSVMVSLDGLGDIHDKVRGQKGNFDSAMKVIYYLRERTDIPIMFGCTISKDNIWHVDALLDFAIKENLYGRFRIAEYINRLYNQDQHKFIRNFSSLESYHLGLFFMRLEREFETRSIVRRTYKNIRSMLIEDSKRLIRCPYQTNSIVLDSRGHLLYCSPKSPNLGSTLQISSKKLYWENIPVRRNIIANDCQDCIHDYHAKPTTNEIVNQARYRIRKQLLNIKVANIKKSLFRIQNSSTYYDELNIDHALILGWYGTETAGDKAILAELIHRLEQRGVKEITLASLNPYLSKWTIKELGVPFVKVIDTYRDDLLGYASHADITIMGGGPLMEISSLGAVLNAFSQAKKAGKYTYIFGCGIGPLNRKDYIRTVVNLLKISDRIELRDTNSLTWAIDHTGRTDIINSGDPAKDYVFRWKGKEHRDEENNRYLNCYLRAWSPEYIGALTKNQFKRTKEEFDVQLGILITQICEAHKLQPRLIAMHHFSIGGDDRVYNRELAHKHLAQLEPIVEIKPYSLNQILDSMYNGAFNITMRFHSTLFAHTLDVPFMAIDYTQGGKVRHYLEDNQALDHYVDLVQVANKQWQEHPLLGITI